MLLSDARERQTTWSPMRTARGAIGAVTRIDVAVPTGGARVPARRRSIAAGRSAVVVAAATAATVGDDPARYLAG